MPHVVLLGKIDPRAAFEALEPLTARQGDTVLKTTGHYLSADARTLLLDALVIDPPDKQAFFVNVSTRDDGVVVRIHPTTEVERTDGVQRLLAHVAVALQRAILGVEVGETNLQAQIDEVGGG